MQDTSIPKSLPAAIKNALEAYANFTYQQDQGYGDAARKATGDWLKAKEKLMTYHKTKRGTNA